MHRMPTTPPPYSSNSPVTNHSINNGSYGTNGSGCKAMSYGYGEGGEMRHSLYGQFPTVNLFKEYQNAAMAVRYSWICYNFHLSCRVMNINIFVFLKICEIGIV